MGFSRGVRTRLIGAVLWMVAAIITVVLLERSVSPPLNARSTTVVAEPSALPTGKRATLSVEAGFLVTRWRVSMGSDELVAESSDQTRWTGSVPEARDGARWEIFVEAESEDFYADHRHALLITVQVDGRRVEQTVWGQGDVSMLLDMDSMLARGEQ